VKQTDATVGFTTVFRTLKALTDCGLARETDFQDGRTRFEHIYNRPHHHHIVCVDCNRTIEFLSPELERLQEMIVAKYQFQTVRHQMQIFGVCPDCQNQRPSPQEVFDSDAVFARDALKIAMEAERSGVNFYLAAAEQISHPSGKATFLRIAEEEKKHLHDLEYEWIELLKKDKNILKAPVFLHFDYESLKKIFPTREEIRQRLESDLDEEQALRLAMDMEIESYRFFREYAERFNDTRGKAIFLKFAAVLEMAGGSLANIVETTGYVLSLEDYQMTAEVRRELFKAPPWPAATGVVVGGLVRADALIEIKGIAVIGPSAPE